MPIAFRVNHICGRLPLNKRENPKIGQCILMSDVNGTFHNRVTLEPTPIFHEIHVLKLARELTDILTGDRALKTWDLFEDENIVFSAKYHDNIAFLFVSNEEYDFQFGVVQDVCGIDGYGLTNLICHMLNGQNVDNFKISFDGGVEMQ